MELHFLGKVTESGNSPTLYGTDAIMFGKEVFVVQGWKVTDPGALAQLRLPDHEAVVAVPPASVAVTVKLLSRPWPSALMSAVPRM